MGSSTDSARKRSPRKKGGRRSGQPELPFVSRISDSTFRDELRGWLAVQQAGPIRRWRGDNLLPPASLLEAVCESFRAGSDLPLEIPYMTALHLIAGLAARRGVTASCGGTEIQPNIWTVVLADSGTGKSLTVKKLLSVIEDPRVDAAGVASARALFDAISDDSRGLWIQDEAGQFLRWASQADQAKLKSILLALGTGDEISWRTRGDGSLRISDHCISLYFLSQTELWTRHNSSESMVDGLLARFGYLIARADPDRPPENFPMYEIDTSGWQIHWDRISSQMRSTYKVGPDPIATYCAAFASIFPDPKSVPIAFSRRLLFRTHQYALLYHLLREPERESISVETYGYAIRLTRTTLEEARHLIGENQLSDLARLVAKVAAYKSEQEALGKIVTASMVIPNVWGIRTVAEAKAILGLLSNN